MFSPQSNFKQSNFNNSSSNLSESDLFSSRLLSPFQRKLLKDKLDKKNLRPEYQRRIEIMLLADEGHSQTQICAALSCSHETARYWTHVAYSGEAHKWRDLPIGRPKTVNEKYLDRLEELVSQSPRDFGYAFKRWTANWLSKHLAKELGITVSQRHVNRLLKQRGLSTRSNLTQANQDSMQPVNGNKQLQESSSNIVIRNLQGKKQSQAISFSPFDLA